ncbi:MAG: RidA family protein [Parcubacteria group bacterium]|nr:RidA family protein [Parcubacteria group bacterium]
MRKAIQTDKAPAAIGPYSQAIKCGNFLFTAGQIGMDPETKELVSDNIGWQTTQALENLKAVIEAGGSTMDKVVKVTVFLTDLGDFLAVNKIYGEFFSEPCPARSCIEVSALPKHARVEFEAIAEV